MVAVGKNYAEHVKEMGGTELPPEPVLFLKPSTSVTGPGDRIAYPVKITDRVDYEGELAVIIGRLCRDVPRERAADVIFGYTYANDVTDARDLQARDGGADAGEWLRPRSARSGRGWRPGPIRRPRYPDVGERLREATNAQFGAAADVPPSLVEEFVSSVMTLPRGDVHADRHPGGCRPAVDEGRGR